MLEAAAGGLRVVLGELAARVAAGCRGRPEREGPHGRRVVGLDPVTERGAEVHQRVADGRHLPVEHAAHAREVVGVEHEVVVLEVVVQQGRRARLRHVRGQPGGDGVHRGDLVGDGGGVAPGPALDLPAHVALGVPERAQPGRVDVERVQLGEGVGGRLRQPPREGRVDLQTRGEATAQHDAADALHQIEPGPEDRFIVAQQQRPRHPRVHRRELAEDRKLAVHVVCRLDLRAERRPAQHQLVLADLQEIGEIRVTARELLDLHVPGQPQRMLQIWREAVEVEGLAHRPGRVDPGVLRGGHRAPPRVFA